MSSNPLEIIETHWLNYRISIDAVKSIKKNKSDIPWELLFTTETTFNNWYDEYLKASNEYIVILLWAAFDQIVINYLENELGSLKKRNRRVKSIIENIAKKNVYDWPTEARLDMLNHMIDAASLKEVYRFRNHYAHRSPHYRFNKLPIKEVYIRIKNAVIKLYPNRPIPDELFI